MFDNIGGKIKILAKVMCYFGTIISEIGGLIIFVYVKPYFILIGFATIILGPIMSWLATMPLYGFGQLVENSDLLVKINNNNGQSQVNRKNKQSNLGYNTSYEHKDKKTKFTYEPCPKCGADISKDSSKCHVCGTSIK